MKILMVRSMCAALLAAGMIAGCGGGGGGGFGFGFGGGGTGTATEPPIQGALSIKTLSNRADMISDGDAMIEVVLPTGARAADLKVTAGDRDVSNQFAVRSDGRLKGVVTGLPVGQTQLTAALTGTSVGAKLAITNTGRGGNIFAGTPIAVWICATKAAISTLVTVPETSLSGIATTKVSGLDSDPVDADCNAPTKYSYYYQPKSLEGSSCTLGIAGANPCFKEYAAGSRPADADIADFTNDRGVKVKSLLRLEIGAMSKSTYQILSYFDPAQPSTVFEPQKGWNQKVLWRFLANATGNRFASLSTNVFGDPVFGVVPPSVFGFSPEALKSGFMVVSAGLTDHWNNNNEILAAEQMMMVKEHIIDTYGEIRYTIGEGGSGGSTMQTVISSVMPGLLDGLQTQKSFDSTPIIWGETFECTSLNNFFKTAIGQAMTPEQRAAVAGKRAWTQCVAWVNAYEQAMKPNVAANCGDGFPANIVYDPVLRPNGVRCSMFDHMTPFIGTVEDSDRNIKPNFPYDTVGVQYGLKALQSGAITPEQFVALNEGVGSLTTDMVWTGGDTTAPTIPAARFRALPSAISVLHKSGAVASPKNLAKVAIIDIRPETGDSDVHQTWRTFAVRARLDAANGHHDNHVVLASSGDSGAALLKKSFLLLDKWLAAVEKDATNDAVEQKVVRNKPADAVDFCITGAGNTDAELIDVGFTSAACPVKDTYSSPRQTAGGPKGEDIFKCSLKPLDFAAGDLAAVTFTAAQQTRLRAVFADGVCDWSKPGQGVVDWEPTTFKAGPGGQRLPAAPQSAPL